MPDIDSLSIRLTSSSAEATKAIQSVIDKLALLNGALNNYTDDSKFVKGMNSLTGGLSSLSSAVKSIDIAKLKDLSTTLGTLATKGQNLAKLNFVQSFAQMGSEAQKMNSAISNTVRSMAKEFDIPKAGIDRLTESVRKLYNANGDVTQLERAKYEIRDLVKEYNTAKTEMDEWAKEIRRQLSRHTFYIPKEVMANWGDDAKSFRAKLGIKNTTTDFSKGAVSLEKFAAEFNDMAGTTFDVSNGLQACANSILEFLNSRNLEQSYNLQATMAALEDTLNSLTAGFMRVSAAESKLSDDDIMLTVPTSNLGEEISSDATEAVASLDNVDTALNNVQAEMNQQMANPFEGLVKGLTTLQAINIPDTQFSGVTTLASTLGKFGSKNIDRAIASIPRVGQAFAQMGVELANMPAISENVIRLAEALSQFSRRANTASDSSVRFGKTSKILQHAFNNLFTSSRRTHKSFTSLAAVFGSLYANFFLLIRGARMLGKAMEYSSSMTEAQNVVSVVFGNSANVMDEFAQTAIKDFGLARLSATEFASRFQAMGKTIGISADQIVRANDFIANKISGNKRAYKDLGDSVADMSINITKLTADMASLYNQDYADVAADMQAIYTGMTRPLRKYGLDLTKATLKEWAMANGLEYDIEKMTQAEKTMLRYQYVMTRTAGAMGDFAKTADTWANAMRTVKQLLQEIARTVGEALINALRPALLAFRDFLFNFLGLAENALNALGKLLGWKQINFGGAALIEDMEDYADAIDDAADAAKKLKGQLRGIDELNNLTTNDKNGSGAGASGLLGAGNESIWDQILDTEEGYESSVKDFFDFGRRISNALKDGLENIDWTSIFGKVTDFGTNLASFLNGLIDPDTWHEFGGTLANGIKAALKLAFSFGDEFDWENLGEAIAEGINGFFEEFNGGELANTLDVWIQGLFTTLKTAAGKLKWKEIFKDLFDFFQNIEIETINITAATGLTILGVGTITAAIGAAIAANPVTIGAIGITILSGYLVGTKISDVLDSALGTNVETGESNWYEFWATVFDFWRDPWEGSKPLTEPIWDFLFVDLNQATKQFEEQEKSWNLFEMFIGEDLYGKMDEFSQKWEEFWFTVFDFWKDPAEESGFNAWTANLYSDIKPNLEDFAQKWEEFWFSIFDFWKDPVKAITGKSVSEIASGLVTDITTNIIDPIKEAFSKIWDNPLQFAKDFFNTIGQDTQDFINAAIDGFKELADAKGSLTGKVINFAVNHITIPKFANGGYPSVGSLFLAGEAGSELVGNINGKTGVASNAEITGITDAIRSTSEAEISLLRQQNVLLQGILEKEFGISSDSIFNSVRNSARDFTDRTGDPAFT